MITKTEVTLELDPWRARQAAMLYHYASSEYLQNLLHIVNGLINGIIDPLLELAKMQGRDKIVRSKRWGNRDTSQVWANNAWPFLKELQESLAKDLALRAFGRYSETAAFEKIRGADQFSMNWSTEQEEAQYNSVCEILTTLANRADSTLSDRPNSKWSDYAFAANFGSFVKERPLIGKFSATKAATARTGEIPPRTGVYVCLDDPNATLQFAWSGDFGCKLRNAKTFSEVGLDALRSVGRPNLWFNQSEMFEFATSSPHSELFRHRLFSGTESFPGLAPSAVANEAFIDRPGVWSLVELYDEGSIDTSPIWPVIPDGVESLRVVGGAQCPVSGFYLSPAVSGSRRYFDAGIEMPIFDSDYGMTVWQWDEDQHS